MKVKYQLIDQAVNGLIDRIAARRAAVSVGELDKCDADDESWKRLHPELRWFKKHEVRVDLGRKNIIEIRHEPPHIHFGVHGLYGVCDVRILTWEKGRRHADETMPLVASIELDDISFCRKPTEPDPRGHYSPQKSEDRGMHGFVTLEEGMKYNLRVQGSAGYSDLDLEAIMGQMLKFGLEIVTGKRKPDFYKTFPS